jgi:hypothetical protein
MTTYYTAYRLPRIEHNTVDVINGIYESYDLIVSRETEPGVYHDAVIMSVWPSCARDGEWCVADILFGGPMRYETREMAMAMLELDCVHHTAEPKLHSRGFLDAL